MSQSTQSPLTDATEIVVDVATNSIPSDEGAFLASFERVEAEIRAVPEDTLAVVNIDVPTAVTTVGGAMNEILALRGAMAKLGDFDIALVDKLRDYAQACGHAHGLYRLAIAPREPITELGQAVTATRDLLHSDALALSKRGLLLENVVAPLRSPSGYRAIAYDTISLVALFREQAPALAGKTPVTAEELNKAILAAEELLAELGERDESPANTAAATLLRQQAFTLFTDTYDQVRRAVAYLRWSTNDADTIAPSLWAGRGKRPTVEAEPPLGTAPGVPGTGTGPTSPSTPGATTPGATTPATSAAIPVGFPGSSPFTS